MRSEDLEAPVDLLRRALDMLPVLAYVLHADGTADFANRYVYDLTGAANGSLEGDGWQAVVHPDDLPEVAAALRDGLAGERTFRLRQRVRSRSGAYERYESITAPVRDGAGRIVRWVGVATDLEEVSRTMALLEASEERLRTFLDTVPQIVWTADASGWLDWYNPRWYEFTGQTPEEAAGWGWQAAHHPDDFAQVMERWPHSIATGEPFEMEFRLRRHDGVFRWMLTRIVPLRDASGNVIRWYGANTDIDDQKLAQQRTTRVAQLLQDALLPKALPSGPGYRFDAEYQPAESDARVGGDWYDVWPMPDGRILLSVGDVTGHGIEAAAHAARVRQCISFAALEDPRPASILARINRLVLAQRLELTTAAVAIFDPQTFAVRYALAGHPPPVLAGCGGEPRVASHGGTLLGVGEAFDTPEYEVVLPPNAVFAFYTDGITEHHRDVIAAEHALCRAAARIVADPRVAYPARLLRDAAMQGARASDDTAIILLQAVGAVAGDAAEASTHRKTWRFHSSMPRSASDARHELMRYLRAVAIPAASTDDAESVIGEILANTVEHAPGLVEVAIDWTGRRARLSVRDSGAHVSFDRIAWPAADAEGGRGVPLVHALASDVRVEAIPGGGNIFSCTLPVERAD